MWRPHDWNGETRIADSGLVPQVGATGRLTPVPRQPSVRRMDTYHVVLYIHLLALFVGIGAGAILIACLFRLRAARTLADAVPFGQLAGKAGKLFPIAILGLFGSGAYMTSDLWSWSTGWIDVSIGGLVLLAVQGPVLGEGMGKRLEAALHANGPGELGDAALKMIRHPLLWGAEFSAMGVVFGIVWNMTQKPGTWGAVAAIVGGYAVGFVLALLCTRAPAPEAVPAADARF